MRWPFVLAALVIPVGYGVIWLRRRWLQREAVRIDQRLQPPRYRYFTHDEELAVKTRERRESAAALRRQAAKKESGTVPMPLDNLREFGQRGKR